MLRVLRASALLSLLACGTAAVAQESSTPEVEIQIIPETDGVQPGQELTLFVTIANRSAVPLSGLALRAQGTALSLALPQPPSSLPPFGSAWGRAKATVPRDGAQFGKHQILVLLHYRWQAGALGGTSLQTATATIDVRRWLDEEAKGLPGGTAALFSLLFPIIPAFLAFQIVDRFRKREGLQVPTFGSEYIVPAFFIALLVNSLLLFPRLRSLHHEEPLRIVGLSLLLGAIWPAARWIWDLLLQWLWGFRESDSEKTYLRKALFSPWSPRPFTWITVKIGEGSEIWSGVFLRQPGGSLVLGSILQVTQSKEPAQKAKKEAVDLVARVNKTGSLRSRWRLLKQVRTNKLGVTAGTHPRHGTEDCGRIVVTGDEVEGWQRQNSERKELLVYSQ